MPPIDPPSQPARALFRFGVAVAVTAVAIAMTVAVPVLLAPMRLFFLWAAVLISAVIGGAAAGLLATVLSALGAAYFLFGPAGTVSIHDPLDLLRPAMFVGFAGGISAAVGLRRRAEERASALSEWLQTTLGSIGDAVISTDSAGRIVFLNEVAQRLTGWNANEATGRPLSDVFVIISEETRQRSESPVEKTLRAGSVTALANHTLLVRRDGTELPIDDSAAPIRAANGEILGVVLVFHDVAEKRALERARDAALVDLRGSERRYRTLVEATPFPQAVFTAAPDGTIEWTDEWLAITGQSRAEVEGGGGLAPVDRDDAARTGRRWQFALERGTLYEDEIRVRVANGRLRWFAIRAAPVVDDRGAIAQWAGVITDIHDRKRYAEESAFINEVTEVLGLSLDYEETMRSVARLCVPAIADWCAIDIVREGQPYDRLIVEHIDPEKARMVIELDRRYRAAPELDPIVEVLRTRMPQVVEQVPDELLVAAAHDEQHLAFIRGVGIRSWILAPMVARGRTLGVISVVTAESERRLTNDDLPLIEEIARRAATAIDNARLYREAEEANHAKDEFLATLSHELRTPLTAIVGWTGMLRMGGLDAATQQTAIDTILRSAQSQRELIDDLLDVSRVLAGKMELALDDVDLVRVAQEVVVSARPAAEAKRLAVDFSSDETRLVLRGDERRLRQVVWNLVSNAVKFTPAGGTISVRVDRNGANVRLSVTDTGRGIAPSFLPHVWERFRQADSGTSRQFGGLGLGLAVARHFVELHGGTVSATSDGEGRGATFTVELPAMRRTAVVDGAQVGAGAATLEGRRIVVIDDEQDARIVISTMLRQYGADVIVASSSEEGALAISVRAPDAILTDIAMPGEDGYGLLRRVRAMAETKHVPVIAVSAIGGTDDRTRLLAAGFADFVRKPVEPQQLAATVAKHV